MKLSFFGQAHYPPAEFPRFVADPQKCKRCGRCVRTCPTRVLVLPEDGPPVMRGYRGLEDPCLGCHSCAAVCPEDAISVDGLYRVSGGRYRTLYQGRMESPNPFSVREPPVFAELEGRLTETERVIYKRRSARLFKKRKEVSEELVRRCLEAARFAPSSGNGTPWEFVVVTDRELIGKIEAASLKSLRLMTDQYLKKGIFRDAIWNLFSLKRPGDMDVRVISGMEAAVHRGKLFFDAPVLVVILMDRRGIGQPELDTGICAQNLVLAAHSLGLATCYVGFITALNSIPDREVMDALGAKWPMKIATSVCLGWPEGEIDKAVSRTRPKVTWIGPR